MTEDGHDRQSRPYADLDRLTAMHLRLMEANAGTETRPGPLPAATIRRFQRRAQATGRLLTGSGDRMMAQRILNYWSAELASSRRYGGSEAGRVVLDPPDSPAAGAGALPSPEETSERLRLGAMARQWRDSNHLPGYLLLDEESIEAAERFDDDPDIRALVKASRKELERRQKEAGRLQASHLRAMRVALIVIAVVAVIAVTTAISLWLTMEAKKKAIQGENSAIDATNNAWEARNEQSESLEKQSSALRKLSEEMAAMGLRAQERQTELDRQQRLVDAMLDYLAAQVGGGAIEQKDLPEPIRETLMQRMGSVGTPPPPPHPSGGRLQAILPGVEFPPPTAASGTSAQSPGFEALAQAEDETVDASDDLPPPAGSTAGAEPETIPEAQPAALEANGYDLNFLGQPLPLAAPPQMRVETLVNHALTVDPASGKAVLAAANLDRSGQVVLPGVAVPGFDPCQGARDCAAGALVRPADVFWGRQIAENPQGAALALSAEANDPANLFALTPSAARAWAQIGEWVRTAHNPAASRVTILSGPMGLDANGRPAAMWKLAVSEPVVSIGPDAPALVIDSFIMPNRDIEGDPSLETFRAPAFEIAARSGLDLPVRQTETGMLVELVGRSGRPGAADADLLMPRLAAALGAGSALSAADRAQVAGAVAAAAKDGAAGERGDLVAVLADVPAADWSDPAWTDARAATRLAVTAGPAAAGDTLRAALALVPKPSQTVYIQYNGIPDFAAEDSRGRLEQLGWSAQPNEWIRRMPENLAEVRYAAKNPADAAAAALLAADLWALGYRKVQPAPNGVVRNGVLEVWIGANAQAAP